MREIARLVVVLTTICIVAAASLAQVYRVTKGPIAEQKRLELLGAIREVLPGFDNQPDREAVQAEGRVFYVGRQAGEFVGAAIPVSSDKGYSGRIEALVGVDAAGRLTGLRVLSHAETPGLGSRITDPAFLNRIVYKDAAKREPRALDNTDWRVRKDGGEIDQITGATISPRALVGAVREGLEDFRDQRARIAAATVPAAEGK